MGAYEEKSGNPLTIDKTKGYSYIQSTIPGLNWSSLCLNPNGGNVGIGMATGDVKSKLHIRNSNDGGDQYSGLRFEPATSVTTGYESYHRIIGFRKSGLALAGSYDGTAYLVTHLFLDNQGAKFGFSDDGLKSPLDAIRVKFTNTEARFSVNTAFEKDVYFGTSALSADQGGSIILKGAAAGNIPYIDFKRSTPGPVGFDGRIILEADGRLTFYSPLGLVFNSAMEINGNAKFNNPAYLKAGTCVGCTDVRTFDFAVQGTAGIVAEKVTILMRKDWPDYVFQPEYRLQSLKETEAFIQANKHLPGVPTAAQVREQGVDVGEMNRILLEKVEELTLRLIQQDKRIEELENKK